MENITKEDLEKMNEAAKDLFGVKEDLFANKEMTSEEYVEMMKNTQPKQAADYVEDKDRIEENGNVVKMTLPELFKMQLDDYKNRWIRARADYENLKKNSEKQYKTSFVDGQKALIENLLPFFDDFDRMIENGFDQVAFNIMVKELNDILKNNSIEIIAPKEGDKFNEDYHDAVMVVPISEKELDNCVKDTFVKGYKHNGNGKIIRYATVSVYKYSE